MTSLADIDIANITKPDVKAFFDPRTWTLSYVVIDPASRDCAIIDPVLDLDYPSGTLATESADQVIDFIRAENLTVTAILETHVHADHVTAAPYLQAALGGKIGIGRDITTVQNTFAAVFNEPAEFPRDGSQFDFMLSDNERFKVGALSALALHVPGHTPACMAYLIGDALFVGDTLFMPDGGTARCDFPGGDARVLYRSIRRLLSLPDQTRVFVCHDYQPNGRELAFETTVAAQRAENIHIRDGIDEDSFVAMREGRDVTLSMPTLILPSLQINMRAGHLPPRDADGRLFLHIPLNAFGGPDLSALSADH